MRTMKLFSKDELSKILNISKTTISDLVNIGKIPYKIIDGEFKFCPETINDWGLKKPKTMDREKYIERYKKRFHQKYPDTIKILHEYDAQFAEQSDPKRFYLRPVKSKKLGTVYHVRYLNNGVLVPSNWSTGTNNIEAAERWAVENRERLLDKYFKRDTVKKPYGDMYTILRRYYLEDSPYLKIDAKRGRKPGEKNRPVYHNFIVNRFVPYLKKNGIKCFEEIDTPLLARFQNQLLKGTEKRPGIKPQSIKHYFCYINQIFEHMIIEGHVKINPCQSLVCLKVNKEDRKVVGCYEINKLRGVFNRKWKNELSYMLNLIICTTNMRNCEIEKIQPMDFLLINGVNFIDIPKSKTVNGERIVPIHNFVYRKIMAYIRKHKKGKDDYLFKSKKAKRLGSYKYKNAYLELAEYTGYSIERLNNENIKFYSGRHFWKTLMDSEKLGDIEEYFMGHKVSGDVAKRYNHKDKQGKKKMIERTKKVFAILDKYIFR